MQLLAADGPGPEPGGRFKGADDAKHTTFWGGTNLII